MTFFEKLAAGHDDVAAFAVDLDDFEFERLVEATRRIHALVAIANDGAGRFLSRHSMAASRHLPQQVETSRVSSSWAMVRTPCFTASAISLSVTALQIHTYIRITFQSGLPDRLPHIFD